MKHITIIVFLLGFQLTASSQSVVKKLRPLSPDRPHQTESPYTVDVGHVQLETDIGNMTYNHLEPRSRSLGLFHFNLKVGIQKRMDIGVLSNAFTSTNFQNRTLPISNSVLPDLTFRYRYNFLGNDSGKASLAIMPLIRTTNFFSEKWKARSGGIFLNAEWELDQGFEVGYTGGISDFKMEPFFKDYELFSTISFDYKVVGALHHFIEVSDRYQPSASIKNNYSIDSGFIYTPSKNNQFDVGFYYFIPVKLFYCFIGTTIRI